MKIPTVKRSQRSAPAKRKSAQERFAMALGLAAMDMWAKLPQKIQKILFETAVVAGHHDERDEALREQLAKFLHERHPRTEHKRR